MGAQNSREDTRRTVRLSGMKTAFTILLIIGCSIMSAHPGTALVTDNRNNVYFAYWGGTWKLDSQGRLERIHSNDFHFLAIDTMGRFTNSKLRDVLRITAAGDAPTLLSFPEYPATFHTDGFLYVAPWSIGRIRIERIKPDVSQSVFVDAAIDPRVARKPGRHEGGVLAIASGPKGFLFVSDGASIWSVDSRGAVSSVAENITVPGCPSDLPPELPKPHIRSLAVDASGDVYAAAIGCRAVLRITATGRIAPVLRAEKPWSPSAVAVANGDLFVMEFDNTLAESPADGRPRIRKIARNGQVTIPVIVDKAQSK